MLNLHNHDHATTMTDDTPIRTQPTPATQEPEAAEPRAEETPTECGLTRQELRAIVAEIIG